MGDFGGKSWFFAIFTYFFKVLLYVPTYSTQMIFYDLEYINSICSSKWYQFHVSALLQSVTINGFM